MNKLKTIGILLVVLVSACDSSDNSFEKQKWGSIGRGEIAFKGESVIFTVLSL